MNSTLIVLLILSILMLVFSAFFSAAETAYSTLSKMTIEKHFKGKKTTDKLIRKHYKSFGWTLSTVLIGNNIVNVGMSAITTYIISSLMGTTPMTTIITMSVVTPILVIFGEVFPKLYAKKHPLSYLKQVVIFMEVLNYLFFPLTFPLSKLNFQSKVTNTEDELKDIINLAYKEKVLENNEATLVANALDLDSIKVSEIMVKRKAIITIKKGSTVGDAISLFKSSGKSRLPAIGKNGEITSILLGRSIIGINESEIIDQFLIKPPVISKNIVLTKALEKMRKGKTHMAFVTETQKTKTTIGIITLEDIFEELVGEIYDETDQTYGIHQIGLHKWFVSGDTKMKRVGKVLEFQEFEKIEGTLFEEWAKKKIKKNMIQGKKYIYKNKYWFIFVEKKENGIKMYEIHEKI